MARALLRTNDDLREEDVKLTQQLHNFERKYKDFYEPVSLLSDTYNRRRHIFPLLRYRYLKNMIKTCVSEIKKRKKAAAQNSEDQGTPASLLPAAKQFHCVMTALADRERTARDEVSQLSKAEIAQDIEDKKKKFDNIENKLRRLHNRTDKLERDYRESRQRFPTRRYSIMKEMIRLLINDEALKALFNSIPVIV